MLILQLKRDLSLQNCLYSMCHQTLNSHTKYLQNLSTIHTVLMLQNILLHKSVEIMQTFWNEDLRKLLLKNLCVPIAHTDPTYFARHFSQASLSLPFDIGNYLLPILLTSHSLPTCNSHVKITEVCIHIN